jgi:hypothetical protein
MQEIYRKDYDGEYVVLNTKIQNGKRLTEKEWVDNPIQNQHISGRAAVIASGESRRDYDVTRLQYHRGGLLGRKKLQTYGTGQLHNEMQLDFFITFDQKKLIECIDSGYSSKATVYTSAKQCLSYPGEFFLVPQAMRGRTATVAAWLACFDGHKEVFLLGFDGQQCDNYNNNIYVSSNDPDKHRTVEDHKIRNQMKQLMTTYLGVDFYLVNNGEKVYEDWYNCANFKTMTYPEWISYCDVQ